MSAIPPDFRGCWNMTIFLRAVRARIETSWTAHAPRSFRRRRSLVYVPTRSLVSTHVRFSRTRALPRCPATDLSRGRGVGRTCLVIVVIRRLPTPPPINSATTSNRRDWNEVMSEKKKKSDEFIDEIARQNHSDCLDKLCTRTNETWLKNDFGTRDEYKPTRSDDLISRVCVSRYIRTFRFKHKTWGWVCEIIAVLQRDK